MMKIHTKRQFGSDAADVDDEKKLGNEIIR